MFVVASASFSIGASPPRPASTRVLLQACFKIQLLQHLTSLTLFLPVADSFAETHSGTSSHVPRPLVLIRASSLIATGQRKYKACSTKNTKNILQNTLAITANKWAALPLGLLVVGCAGRYRPAANWLHRCDALCTKVYVIC